MILIYLMLLTTEAIWNAVSTILMLISLVDVGVQLCGDCCVLNLTELKELKFN